MGEELHEKKNHISAIREGMLTTTRRRRKDLLPQEGKSTSAISKGARGRKQLHLDRLGL